MSPDNHRTGRLRSLGVRYVALIVTIVIVAGVLTGLVVTMFSIRNAALERRANLEYAGAVVAAAVMPVIADQDETRVRAQLRSIVSVTESDEIECIEIIDASGAVLAETEEGCTCSLVEPGTWMLDVFTKPQVVTVPIELEGMLLASVRIQFRPVGLESALWEPIRATVLISLVIIAVAAAWGAWVSMRTIIEPIGRLADGAAVIATGGRDFVLHQGRRDEIGELECALDDMTIQLAAQEGELRESYRSLELAFERQATLAEQLERALAVKSDFVAVASHELRSPLAVLQLYTEMLEAQEFGEVDASTAGAASSIASATQRLTAIVANLMDVSLLERGLMPLEFADVDLGSLIRGAVLDARHQASKAGIVLTGEDSLPEVIVRVDKVRIRQVMDNLLSNAIKYSAEGESVAVSMVIEDEEVVIDVADTGRGIPEGRREVLFDLFSRGDTQDNADVPGLGLGLTIASRIVLAHGGEISFRDNPVGRGTVFSVRMPRRGVSFREGSANVRIV